MQVSLKVDGQVAATGSLDTAQPHQPIRMQLPAWSGNHTVEIEATPALSGLAFSIVQQSWLPWIQQPSQGLEVQASLAGKLVVGQSQDLQVAVAGPAGKRVEVSLGLPAGVTLDEASLSDLQSNGQISSWKNLGDRVLLSGIVLNGGSALLHLPVTPGLAGELQSGPTQVWPEGESGLLYTQVPSVWSIL